MPELTADQYRVVPPIPASFDARAANELASAGMSQALRAERVTAWKQQADAWLASQTQGTVLIADDLIRDIGLPDLPGPALNNVIGAWFSAKSRIGSLVFLQRHEKSARPEGHGNLQRVWRIA